MDKNSLACDESFAHVLTTQNKSHNVSFNLKESENEPKKYQISESMSTQTIHHFFQLGFFHSSIFKKMIFKLINVRWKVISNSIRQMFSHV